MGRGMEDVIPHPYNRMTLPGCACLLNTPAMALKLASVLTPSFTGRALSGMPCPPGGANMSTGDGDVLLLSLVPTVVFVLLSRLNDRLNWL